MRPDQLGDFVQPSDPCLHPDGVRVAFTVSRMDLERDRYVRRIWLWEGSEARPLTAGPGDTRPRWSPDGEALAFLRKPDDDEAYPQLAVLPAGGGEAETVTDFSLGVSAFVWSPEGSQLVVVATEWHGEWADLSDEERKRRPRRITRLAYRGDNRGWLHDRRSHLWLMDRNGENQICLTPGAFDETAPAWHPDGDRIAFVSARHDENRIDPGNQVWEVHVAGGDPDALVGVGAWSSVSYDRAGNLYAIGHDDQWAWPAIVPLWRIESGTAVDLTSGLDRSVDSGSPPIAPPGPQWMKDGSALSILEDAGRLRVVEVTPEGEANDVLGGDRLITGFSANDDASAVAFVATTPTNPGELFWWEDGKERRLTDLNGDFAAATTLTEPERFTFERDGVEIEGWAYVPAGEGRVPLLLNIHGGPATQYGYGFFDEFQVYAGAGYGVVAINPRGSTGYGTDFMRAVVGAWQNDDPPDIADFERAVEVALDRFPRLDGSRLGVMGGSYGGLATVRVLARNQAYRSAIAERGLYAWVSFAGSSDIGPFFDRMYVGEQLPDGHDALWAASPLAHAHSITTPTLVIHSESDFRTPIEQGEQLFALLKRLGVETEMLRFPAGESHELSRSGKPKHRLERFEAILDWHERHLS
jgi:dipeptidyl aminopeptidase/acylaminoacyl peptidase